MDPKELPVQRIRETLIEALTRFRAVVIEGPTGCGKTTQVPQMLADSPIVPVGKRVGVTQPRRIAAVSVAWRIAKERQVALGTEVGYAIRFDDQSCASTRIRLMTDGILLQEARGDPWLRDYAVIMVDEAHERTLNIDFTLGLLRELLDRRDDLRVVVSSATINARSFQRFFGDCPRIEVEARTFPVDVVWRPLRRDDEESRTQAIVDVVTNLHRPPAPVRRAWTRTVGPRVDAARRDVEGEPGDVLAFLAGENEIKAAATALENSRLPGLEILPLYGRLTREEQERVFDHFPGRRKVILSTNIAETSITIDGVRTVIDVGTHKVPSYDPRTGVSSLREEPVSQASARQRLGRAGRTAPGTCVRLYAERDFNQRPEYPVEEILRMDLIEVVLRLLDLGIRDVEHFPLVTPPPRWLLGGAIRELIALGAITDERELTSVGRRMAVFPLAPRLSRMVVEGADRAPDIMDDVIAVGALLSAKWPQVLPPGEEQAAREAHRQFADPLGDLVAGIRMLRAYERARDPESFCHRSYLDPTIMEEIVKVRDQLGDIARHAGIGYAKSPTRAAAGATAPAEAAPARPAADAPPLRRRSDEERNRDLLRCVATAFPRQICRKEPSGFNYESATGVTAGIHPGSCLSGKKPFMVVAAEIVVTGRPWMRTVNLIDPDWVVEIDPRLADRWGLRAQRREPKERKEARPPQVVQLGGESITVTHRRGKASTELDWEVASRLAAALAGELPSEFDEVEVVLTRSGRRFVGTLGFAGALALTKALDLAPVTLHDAPESELLEPDRDLERLVRGAAVLGRVAGGRHRGGFWSLFANGAGGYWFDVTRDLATAVEQSRLALAALGEHPSLSAEDEGALHAIGERLDAIAEPLGLD